MKVASNVFSDLQLIYCNYYNTPLNGEKQGSSEMVCGERRRKRKSCNQMIKDTNHLSLWLLKKKKKKSVMVVIRVS